MMATHRVCSKVGKGQIKISQSQARGVGFVGNARRSQICSKAGVTIPGPTGDPIEVPIPEDLEQTVTNALNYAQTVDLDLIQNEINDGLGEVGNLLGVAFSQFNSDVFAPAWAKAAPELEAYFRQAWGDYYYDYFIDEWNSGVKDLERLYNFVDGTVVAGDWRRLLALIGFTVASPGITKTIFSLGKGYKGDINALEALQLIERKNAVLIDVRLGSEKASTGIPDLPNRLSDAYVDVGYAGEWLSPDVRRQLRDTRLLESRATATVIADLKRVNGSKGQQIVVLDNNDAGRSAFIAKALARDMGFRNVYVLKGGFNSWKKSKLQVRDIGGTQAKRGLFQFK